jgi:hypothetical protein
MEKYTIPKQLAKAGAVAFQIDFLHVATLP